MAPREYTCLLRSTDPSGITTITLNRPEIKNALTLRLLLELYWAFEEIKDDPASLAVILTGSVPPGGVDPAKEAFSSGGYFNFSELENMSPEVKAQVDLSDLAQKKLCLKIWEVEKPIIAALNGMAIGGGFTIPFACADLIYASEHAWVSFPFVRLGIAPELASSYLLPRLIGLQKTKELFFFGERLSAKDLLELGMINKVLPHKELLPYARTMALRLIPPQGPGLAVRWAKRILHQPLVDSVSQALDRENQAMNSGLTTTDFMEALTARIEKRDPVFKGK